MKSQNVAQDGDRELKGNMISAIDGVTTRQVNARCQKGRLLSALRGREEVELNWKCAARKGDAKF